MLDTARICHALVPQAQHVQSSATLSEFPWLQILVANDDGAVTDGKGNILPADLSKASSLAVEDNSAAYVLFTSGSTGKPKGCQVPHRGSALYAKAVVENCHLDQDMVFLMKTPYVFDVS